MEIPLTKKKNGGGGRSTSSTIWERGNGELISIIRAFGLPGYCMYSWLCSMSLYVNREGGGTIISFWKKKHTTYLQSTYKNVLLQTIIHKQVLSAICPESFLLWIFKNCWLYFTYILIKPDTLKNFPLHSDMAHHTANCPLGRSPMT